MKILIVEDERSLREAIGNFLSSEGYRCEMAENFEIASEKMSLYEYDCVLLDITLPGGNGLKLLDAYKKDEKKGGVIIISARDSLDDKVSGLELGADDYLTKPFHLHELSARISSLIRRLNFQGNRIIKFEDIEIKPDSREVSIAETSIHLTRTEFELLLFFVQNQSRVISKSAIAEHIYGDNSDMADSYDFIYSQIKNLRKKLNEHSSNDYIHAVYGVGYRLSRK